MYDPVASYVVSNSWDSLGALGGAALLVLLWALWRRHNALAWYAGGASAALFTIDVATNITSTGIETQSGRIQPYSPGLIVYSTAVWLLALTLVAAAAVLVYMSIRRYHTRVGTLAALALLAVFATMACDVTQAMGVLLNNGSLIDFSASIEYTLAWAAIGLTAVLLITVTVIGFRAVRSWNKERVRRNLNRVTVDMPDDPRRAVPGPDAPDRTTAG